MIQRRRIIDVPALPSQQRFFASKAFAKGFSGPIGSGKTYALCYEALQCAARNPGSFGMLGAPTYPMMRDVTQRTLFEILEEKRIRHTYRKQENVLKLASSGSTILFRSLERFEHLRGQNLAWVGVDELTYCREDAWLRLEGRVRDPRAVRPEMFAVWTPKGFDWVYRRFIAPNERLPNHDAIIARPAENFVILSNRPDFYDQLKNSYDERFYQQEVLGEYLNVNSGRVYHAYSETNEDETIRYAPEASLCWALDFNVDPMTAVIAQFINGKIFVLDEIFLPNANTVEMCERFEACAQPYIAAYQAAIGVRPMPLTIYGDATGQARSTASKTDYDLIREYFRSRVDFQPRFDYPKQNPRVKDRVNSVNAMLKNVSGAIRLRVHPRCKDLITDFHEVVWKEGSADFALDKTTNKKRTHLSDALGYMVWQEARIDGFRREIIDN